VLNVALYSPSLHFCKIYMLYASLYNSLVVEPFYFSFIVYDQIALNEQWLSITIFPNLILESTFTCCYIANVMVLEQVEAVPFVLRT